MIVIGMEEVKDHEIDGILYEGFCAENIKMTIEKIVNKYNFDKSIIKGKYLKLKC